MKKIYVFGESHFDYNDVKRIRTEVIKIFKKNPSAILLHELYFEDKDFYKKYGIDALPLEDKVNNAKPYNKMNLREISYSMTQRETSMVKHLERYLSKSDTIIIVCGDTHIRQKYNKGLLASPLTSKLNSLKKDWEVIINRTKNPEAK